MPASRRARTSRPGSAPMYVRRCPRISASSRTPPSDIRTNCRPVARAIDSPIEVLPVPGGPISVRMAPDRRSSVRPRSARSLRTARYSVMRCLTSSRPAWSASSTSPRVLRVEALLRPLRPRHGEQPVEIGADHGRLGVRVAHPLESRQLALGLLLHRLGHRRRPRSSSDIPRQPSPRSRRAPCGSRPSAGAGRYSRCCFCAPDSTSSRMRLRTRSSASRSCWNRSGQRQPLDDVERFEQLQLLVDVQIRRVAGGVGQGAGIGDRAHERADPAIVAAQLEDFLHDRAILALEIARQARRRRRRPDARRPPRAGRRPGRCAPRRARRGGAP